MALALVLLPLPVECVLGVRVGDVTREPEGETGDRVILRPVIVLCVKLEVEVGIDGAEADEVCDGDTETRGLGRCGSLGGSEGGNGDLDRDCDCDRACDFETGGGGGGGLARGLREGGIKLLFGIKEDGAETSSNESFRLSPSPSRSCHSLSLSDTLLSLSTGKLCTKFVSEPESVPPSDESNNE